jgi:hypothetical protein
MQEIEIIEKARKGEITLPEAMTDEETKMMEQNINVPFCRRWANESQARWEQKKAEMLEIEMTPEQITEAHRKMMKALSEGVVE